MPEQGFWERVKPWECPACKMKNISANKTECPRCHEPRYGSTAEPGSKAMSFGQQMQEAWTSGITFWICPTCGQSSPMATMVCPKCQEPQPGTPAAQTQESIGQATREYEGDDALRAGIALMATHGWRVVSQSSFQPNPGAGRIALLGLGAAVIKPKPRFVVIFEKVKTDA